MRHCVIVIVALMACALGCGKTSPPPRVAAKPVVAKSVSNVVAPPKPGAQTAAEEVGKKSPDGDRDAIAPQNSDADKGKPQDDDKSSGETTIPAERVAVLTPGGPLLVDVRLTLDGQPYGAALQSLVKQVLEASDTNKDGRSTWKELSANEEFLKSQPPDARQRSGAAQLNEWLDQHDVNQNDQIEPAEAASWLGRGAGRTARAFALRTSRAFSPDPRMTSQLWPLFDADKDGRLSSEELARVPDRLWSRDADDDRVIALSELASLRDQLATMGGAPMPMRTSTGAAATRLAALHLEPKSDLERVDYVLQDMYAPLQDLAPSSFSELPRLFGQLDANGDDWLERSELANMRSVPAHVELAVAFTRSPAPGQTSATIEVLSHAPEATVLPGGVADRVLVALGKTRLVLAARDLIPAGAPGEGRPAAPAPGDANQTLQETQVRLVVHDQSDALFDELDANCDGRLGEREIATAPARLTRCDANGDGQLSGDETPYEMIVAFVRGEALGEQSFTTPPSRAISSSASPGAAVPAWFAFADLNHDGDVSRREFLGADAQFAALDANGDNYVDLAESAGAAKK